MTSRRPVIAISSGRILTDYANIPSYPLIYVGADYVRAILAAGGTPMVLGLHDPEHYPGVLAEQLDVADGLVLSGGVDVSPLYYGEEPHQRLGHTLPERDRFELALIDEARRRELPVLGVCRGIQVLNVAHGGTLFQDLPTERPNGIQHEQASSRWQVTHHVDIRPGSRVAELTGVEGSLTVTSFHHQAIKELGEGLEVTATAPDGVIEAVESTTHPWMVGVQWHPEMSHTRDESSIELFRGFVSACTA